MPKSQKTERSSLENSTTGHSHNIIKHKNMEAEVTAMLFKEDRRFRTRSIPNKRRKFLYHKSPIKDND